MKRYQKLALATTGAALSFTALQARPVTAALLMSYQITGNVGSSIDAVGSNNTPVGTLRANIPAGSTIEKAFLYSSIHGFPTITPPNVSLDSTNYSGSAFTPLTAVVNASQGIALQAFRADVTSQVASKVGNGGGITSFTVNENGGTNNSTDGEVLAIAYSNPTKPLSTVAFLDGGQDFNGDTFNINYAKPLDTTVPNFQEQLSLGIGFSYQSPQDTKQFSTVDVNGRRLTSAAGGQDDGAAANGALITAGSFDDNPANPPDPLAGPNGNPGFDDELYNLALGNSTDPTPFVKNGDTSTNIFTRNPSNDDLIFFTGVNVTAQASVETASVPEPSSALGLLAFGSLSASYMLKRQLKERKAANVA